jgi:hypothetical protein
MAVGCRATAVSIVERLFLHRPFERPTHLDLYVAWHNGYRLPASSPPMGGASAEEATPSPHSTGPGITAYLGEVAPVRRGTLSAASSGNGVGSSAFLSFLHCRLSPSKAKHSKRGGVPGRRPSAGRAHGAGRTERRVPSRDRPGEHCASTGNRPWGRDHAESGDGRSRSPTWWRRGRCGVGRERRLHRARALSIPQRACRR